MVFSNFLSPTIGRAHSRLPEARHCDSRSLSVPVLGKSEVRPFFSRAPVHATGSRPAVFLKSVRVFFDWLRELVSFLFFGIFVFRCDSH